MNPLLVHGGAGAQRRSLLAAVFVLSLTSLAPGAETASQTKPDGEAKKPDPPRFLLSLPLALQESATNVMRLRGLNLTNVTALRLRDETAGDGVRIKSTGKADVPKEADVKKVGDSQIEVEWWAGAEKGRGKAGLSRTNWVVAISPDGEGEPWPVWIVSSGRGIPEKEPNGGFATAQAIPAEGWVTGTIQEPADVDVYRFECRQGQRYAIEIRARPLGSALDSLLTVHDGAGRVLVTNDDAAGSADSGVEWLAGYSGTVLVCVQDALDKGGVLFPYLLQIRAAKKGD